MSSLRPDVPRIREMEDAWNRRDGDRLALTNTVDCQWRNRVYFLWGREQVRTFVERQFRREIELRIAFEGWSEADNKVSVRFASEFRSDSGIWFRAYGCETIEFDDTGLIKRRFTSANEHAIPEHERALLWPAGPRPLDYPSLSELGF